MIDFTRKDPDSPFRNLGVDFSALKEFFSRHSDQYIPMCIDADYGVVYIFLSPEPRKIILEFESGGYVNEDKKDFNFDEFEDWGREFFCALYILETQDLDPIVETLLIARNSIAKDCKNKTLRELKRKSDLVERQCSNCQYFDCGSKRAFGSLRGDCWFPYGRYVCPESTFSNDTCEHWEKSDGR